MKLYATLLILLIQLRLAYCQTYSKEDLYGYYRITNGCTDSLGAYENMLYLNKNGYEWKIDENGKYDNDVKIPLRLIYKGTFEVNDKKIYLRTNDSTIVATLAIEDSLNLKLISFNTTAVNQYCYFNRYERHFYNDKGNLVEQWFIKRSIRKTGRHTGTDPYYIITSGGTQSILPLGVYK